MPSSTLVKWRLSYSDEHEPEQIYNYGDLQNALNTAVSEAKIAYGDLAAANITTNPLAPQTRYIWISSPIMKPFLYARVDPV